MDSLLKRRINWRLLELSVLVEELRAGRMPDNAMEMYQKLLDMRDELKAFA